MIKLANSANDWPEVLEQPFLQNIVDRLATKRPWAIEEVFEADEAGWVAQVRDGKTIFRMSLTIPAKMSADPPPRIIEWTLEADADRDEKNKPSIALAVIMFGMGGLFVWLAYRLGVRFALLPVVGALGIFPVGLFLGVLLLHPLATRREARRAPVAGRAEFLQEVAAAVAQLPTPQA